MTGQHPEPTAAEAARPAPSGDVPAGTGTDLSLDGDTATRDAGAGADIDAGHAGDAPPRHSGLDDRGRVKRTRAATAWASVVGFALVTVLFVVFVIQNSQSIGIHFLWLDGRIAAAAALLIAAVAGALLVGLPAAIRIGQLRHALKRNAQG